MAAQLEETKGDHCISIEQTMNHSKLTQSKQRSNHSKYPLKQQSNHSNRIQNQQYLDYLDYLSWKEAMKYDTEEKQWAGKSLHTKNN